LARQSADAGIFRNAWHYRLQTIGKRVARIAAGGFNMRIQYSDIVRLTEDTENALNVRYRLLPELPRTSGIVTLYQRT
jgi:lactate dehydrogenase-like 2-hydroxyacid dehydrogenase